MEHVRIPIKRLRPSAPVPLPEYMTEGAAGMDLCAALEQEITLAPLERQLIPTGLAIALPIGFEAQVRPRSGPALSQGLTLLNSPGTIDADYRGEIQIIAVNLGSAPASISPGQRIAQLVVQRVIRVSWDEVEDLENTARSAGGFGHTDLKK